MRLRENINYIELHIKCNNDAFYNEENQEPEPEVVRILRKLADSIEANGIEDATHILKDINGNKVGEFGYSEEY